MVLCLNLVATKITSYNHEKVIYLSLHFRLPCALKDTTMACSSPTLRVSSLGVTEKLSSLSLHCKQEWRQTAKEKWFQLNEQQKGRNVQWKGKEKKTGAQRNKEGEKEREKLKVEVEKAKKKKKKRQNINGSLLCLPQSEPKMSQRLTQTPDPIRKVKVRITLSFSCTSMFPAFFNGSVCWLDLPSGADKLTV